jgi:hypothetical protein
MNETEQKTTNWLDDELKTIGTSAYTGERLPAMKFEQNKIVELKISFKEPFQKYNTTNTKEQPITKAIIPVVHDGEKKIWWLNVKNPIYREIMEKAKLGKENFKVLQTGIQAETKYILVE